jgi:MFS family permease
MGGRRKGTADSVRATAVLVAAVAQVVGSPLGTAISGRSVGDVSDETRSLITPAGWAFTIWALIFAGSLAWAVYQALPAQRRLDVNRRTGWPLAAAFAGNAAWEVLFPLVGVSQPVVPVVLILAIVAAAATAFARLQDIAVHGAARVLPGAVTGLLLGWVTVAAVVNVASAGVALGAEPEGTAANAWAVAALAAAAAVTVALTLAARAGAGPIVLAVVWGTCAIAAAADERPVVVAALAAAVAAASALVVCAAVRPDTRTLLVG